MTISAKEIGERLKAARQAKGLTQVAAAKALHVRPASVSYWESGDHLKTIIRLQAVCDLYGLSVGSLFNEVDG